MFAYSAPQYGRKVEVKLAYLSEFYPEQCLLDRRINYFIIRFETSFSFRSFVLPSISIVKLSGFYSFQHNPSTLDMDLSYKYTTLT